MKVLVTGGAGYIGSHTVVELVKAGHEIAIADNLSNSNIRTIRSLTEILDREIQFFEVDLCDFDKSEKIFAENKFEAVIHFAALKAVGESVDYPLNYYSNNLISTINLCRLMEKCSVNKFVFSSSATVYGDPEKLPIEESAPSNRATNPYGRTKAIIEQLLKDWTISNSKIKVSCLRYFNPIGAHGSGLLGESPNGTPNNLLPYIVKVAAGELDELKVFGDDYPTPDGTGIRDYIHVADLAKGHLKALDAMDKQEPFEAINLGAGRGTSVLELIRTFEKATGRKVPYRIVGRRKGDIPKCYADASKASEILGWESEKTLADGCLSSWVWQQNSMRS